MQDRRSLDEDNEERKVLGADSRGREEKELWCERVVKMLEAREEQDIELRRCGRGMSIS